jgi:hypothetical protein
MAANTDRELRILLKLIADTADQSKITASLNQIQAQAKLASTELAATAKAAEPISGQLELSNRQMGALTRTITSGHASVRTIGALFGGMGTAITGASFAAFALVNLLVKQYQQQKQVTDELEAQIDGLEKQKAKWGELVAVAGEYKDVVAIDAQVARDLEKVGDTLDTLNAKFLKYREGLAKYGPDVNAGDPFAAGAPAEDSDIQTAKKAIVETLTLRQKDHAEALKNAADWQNIQTEPYQQQLVAVGAKLDDLKGKRADLEKTISKGLDPSASATQVSEANKALTQLTRINSEELVWQQRINQAGTATDALDQKTLKLAQDIRDASFKDLDPDERLKAIGGDVENVQQKLREMGIEAQSPADAIEQLQKNSKAWDDEQTKGIHALIELWRTLLGIIKQTEKEQDDAAGKAVRDRINASLREQSNLLENIHRQQQQIDNNPFLLADQKQALSRAAMVAEMAALGGAIAKNKQDMAGGPLDENTHIRLQSQIDKDKAKFDELGHRIEAIDHPFATELITWVNSLGTTAHQAANILTGTLQTAIDGISQGITGLILGTENFEQAWNQAVTSVIANIVKMVVQFIAGQIAMFVIRQVFGAQEQAITNKAAAQSAAEWAPAAISASIASYGAASGFGVAAYIAALAVGEAAAVGVGALGGGVSGGGGFRKGGYTGAGHEDEYAGPAHRGEFYFSKRETESIGLDRLYAMKQAAPHFGAGGRALPPLIYPGWTFGPSGSRTGFTGPTASTEWMWDHGARFVASDLPGLPAGGPPTGGAGTPNYPRLGNLNDDIPPADLFDPYYVPPFTVVGPDGQLVQGAAPYGVEVTLPGSPGAGEGPGLFPNQGGITITNVGGEPRYVASPNYLYNFGNNLGLGSNLLSSLILLGYGTNRYVPGGTVSSTYSGPALSPDLLGIPEVTFAPSVTPGSFIPGPNRIDPGFIDPATGLSLATTGTVIGHDTVTGAPIVRGAGGQVYVLSGAAPYGDINTRFGPGSGPWNADQFTKSYLLGGGDPGGPNTVTVGDAGRDLFRSGFGRFDPETGGISVVSATNRLGGRDPRWVFPSQAESARLGLSFDANKNNAWLIAHNPWFYDAIPHGASGMRLPGSPSGTDSMLAWLAPGEHVIDAFTTAKYDSFFGGQHWTTDLLKNMSVNIPRLATGGRAGGATTSTSSQEQPVIDVHVYNFTDLREAQRSYQDSPHARKVFRRNLGRYS